MHHQDGAVGNISWPVVHMLHQGADYFLRAGNAVQIVEWFAEEFFQPEPATFCFGKIELVKNGKFLLLMEDGNIIKGNFINLHEWIER